MALDPLLEIVVPNAGCCQINGIIGILQGQFLGKTAFAGALTACYEKGVCHYFVFLGLQNGFAAFNFF